MTAEERPAPPPWHCPSCGRDEDDIDWIANPIRCLCGEPIKRLPGNVQVRPAASDERPEAAPAESVWDVLERLNGTVDSEWDGPKIDRLEAELRAARERIASLADELEMAWVIIANAGGGNWDLESKDWQDAAAKWRDEYHGGTGEKGSNAPDESRRNTDRDILAQPALAASAPPEAPTPPDAPVVWAVRWSNGVLGEVTYGRREDAEFAFARMEYHAGTHSYRPTEVVPLYEQPLSELAKTLSALSAKDAALRVEQQERISLETFVAKQIGEMPFRGGKYRGIAYTFLPEDTRRLSPRQRKILGLRPDPEMEAILAEARAAAAPSPPEKQP